MLAGFVRRRGFTLIELLIVIAIILILIAIALPNFLEAQIRARIAAAKGNLRTIQTALESYALDNKPYKERVPNPDPALRNRYGPYPPYGQSRFRWSCNTNYEPGCLNILSTPVKYLTDAGSVQDPFQSALAVSDNDDTRRRPFGYYTPGHQAVVGKFFLWHQLNLHRRNPSTFSDYWVYSMGPDTCSNADGDFRSCWTADYTANGFADGTYWEYSPTNGTKSGGDIHLLHGLGVVN
jgi:prepilin-type N-terminal cleavage/methylation domain-containing protein